jgi:hypothetical protein
MKILHFLLFLVGIFVLLDPDCIPGADPDPADQNHADPDPQH